MYTKGRLIEVAFFIWIVCRPFLRKLLIQPGNNANENY